MYLLDTNIVSELRRNSPQAGTWLRSVRGKALWISIITLGEIKRGIDSLARRDAATADSLQHWLGLLRVEFAAHLLPITGDIALAWGKLASIRTRGMADGLIAATAIVHNLTLVTRNVSDFADLEVPLIDPWHPQHPTLI